MASEVYQAIQSFHAVRSDGQEIFVPSGKVYPAGHEFVVRDTTGVLFTKLNLDDDTTSSPAPTPVPNPAPAPVPGPSLDSGK